MSDYIANALADVELVPEHDLRRLLERMAVTHPNAVSRSVHQMIQFDRIRRQPYPKVNVTPAE